MNESKEEIKDMIRTASGIFITKQDQVLLVNNSHKTVRTALAKNTRIHEDIQKILSGDKCPSVRAALAQNYGITPEIQITLSKDMDRKVEMSLANNIKLCEEVIHALSMSGNRLVRASIASKANIPVSAQTMLSLDCRSSVRMSLARNYGIAETTQIILSRDEEIVMVSLAKNPHITEISQYVLCRNGNLNVCITLARNQGLSPSVRDLLIQDGRSRIQDALNLSGNLDDAPSPPIKKARNRKALVMPLKKKENALQHMKPGEYLGKTPPRSKEEK